MKAISVMMRQHYVKVALISKLQLGVFQIQRGTWVSKGIGKLGERGNRNRTEKTESGRSSGWEAGEAAEGLMGEGG